MSPSLFHQLRRRLLRIVDNATQPNSRSAVLDILSNQLRALVKNRGESLVRRGPTTSVSIEIATPPVPAAEVVAAHLASLVHKRLARLVETRHFEAAKDPVAAVHDLRVASRRLRAFVDVFDPVLDTELRKRARKALRDITRAARTARDLDVQLATLREYYARTTAEIERAALEELLVRTEAHRRKETRRLRKRLRQLDWKEINTSLSTVLGTAVTHLPESERAVSTLAWQLLEPLARVNHWDVRPGTGEETTNELHEFRIQLKKLRYGLEIFEPVLGSAFASLYDPVESTQELLGHLHDLSVLEDSIRRQRRDLERENRTTLALAVMALESKLTERRRRLYEEYRIRAFDWMGWQRALKMQLAQPSNV